MEVGAEQEKAWKTAGNEDFKCPKLMTVVCISQDLQKVYKCLSYFRHSESIYGWKLLWMQICCKD